MTFSLVKKRPSNEGRYIYAKIDCFHNNVLQVSSSKPVRNTRTFYNNAQVIKHKNILQHSSSDKTQEHFTT